MKDPIRYAKSGDVNIAYQVMGKGPFDLVLVPGFFSHLEIDTEHPSMAHLLERLAASWLFSTDQRARSGVGSGSVMRCTTSTSQCAQACTPARSSVAPVTSHAGSPSTSALG
jgi:hypothetical protein